MVLDKPAYRFNGRLPAALDPLKERAQWICWTYIETKPGKWTKPPLSAHTGRPAAGGAQHPDNWGTFEQALATQRRHNLAGVGYVLTRDDNITGIDLDDCITDSGSYNEIAAEVLSYGETYGELSPSKKGIRLFVLGKYAGGLIKNDGVGVEVYTELRYLTVTGLHHEDTPAEIAPAPRTLAFLAKLGLAKPKQETPALPPPRAAGGDFFGNVNSAALAALDRWVPDLHPSAKKQATGAWRITSYGLNRDLEEDLSYHPTGIRDHGEEVGLTPIDAVLKHGTAANAIEAAHWLCHRLGVEPAAFGWQGAPKPVNLKIGGQPADSAQAMPAEAALEFDDEIQIETKVTALVKGLLHPGEVAAVYGPSGVGKSFAAIDLAYHLAHGLEWHGRKVPGKVPALIVGLEGVRGLRHRMLAYAGFLGNAGKMLARLTVHAALDRSETGAAGEATIVANVAALAEKAGQPVGLIIIDTLARAMAGDDENSTQDMNAFIARVTAIARTTGAAVLVVHHTGKDDSRGMRGSTTLFAACDLVLRIAEQGNGKLVTAEKVKDGETGRLFAYQLERKVLAYDDDMEEITTCIVKRTDIQEAVPDDKLTANQATMLAILRNAKRPLTTDEWNNFARAEGIGTARKATLFDLRENLRRKGLIYEGVKGWALKL